MHTCQCTLIDVTTEGILVVRMAPLLSNPHFALLCIIIVFSIENSKAQEQNLRQKTSILSKLIRLHQHCEVTGCITEKLFIYPKERTVNCW